MVQRDQQRFDRSLRTADVSPRSSPLRDVSLLLAKRPSAAMSEKKRLPFAGYFDRRQEFSHSRPQSRLALLTVGD